VEPPEGLPLASRLLAIHEGLAAVLGDFRPAEAAVEQTFVNKDGVATLKLGQARGVAMLAPAMFGISVAEYAPNQVKKNRGRRRTCRQEQILMMLKNPAAQGRAEIRRCRRRARHRHHARASPRERHAAAEGGGDMIGKLKGLIDSYGEDFVILDVGGVGYQVHCSARTLQALPATGEAAVLSIEPMCARTRSNCFGFRSDTEREMVSAAADRAGRRRQGGAGGALYFAAG